MANLPAILRRGARDGLILSATTGLALAAASYWQRGSAWAAINPICHMLDGDDRTYGDTFDVRDSSLGLAMNSSAMIAWSILYRLAFGRARLPESIPTGLATAAGAYVIDYHVVPKRFTPGIEKKVSWTAIGLTYVVLGLTLAVTSGTPDDENL